MATQKNTKDHEVLSPNQLKAIHLLIDGKPCNEVAKEVEVHPCTISAWKTRPHFRSAMNVLLREQREDWREKIRSMGNDALETVSTVMKDKKNASKIKT